MAEFVAGGGCYCGNLRIQASGQPLYISYCHCRDCRKFTGAPVTVFVGYRTDQIEIHGSPGIYSSSPEVQRSFCTACGSPISYEDEGLPQEMYLTVGVFDEPEQFGPWLHGWTAQSLGWLRIEDDLPRCEGTSRPR